MAGKFKKLTDTMAMDISALFNRAIRQALIAGVAMAVARTKQDSSNAAAHWMLASKTGKTARPESRRFGKLRDLRGNKSRAGVHPVGRRGDGGVNSGTVIKYVREKELREVVDRLITGRDPETVFYLFNAVGAVNRYSANAEIAAAGEAAMQEIKRIFEMRVAAGNVRKRYK